MINYLHQSRWLIALRGIIAIVFGVLALLWPGLTALTLVLWLGIYLLIDGVLAIITGIRHRADNDRWWVLLLEGIVGIVAAIYIFLFPQPATLAVLLVIAAWAIVTGVLEIVFAIRMRREIHNEWMIALTGVVSILFGIIILLNPAAGLMGIVWAIGAYAILFGILMLILAITARRLGQRNLTP